MDDSKPEIPSIELSTWDRLKKTPPKRDLLTARIAFPDLSKILLAAIDAEHNRHFLIKLSPEDDELVDNKSRGVLVASRELTVKGSSHSSKLAKYIDIVCRDTSGYAAFDIVGYEIAASLDSRNLSKAELVQSVLARWRHFWGQPPKNLLSREEVIGLFAELWFFKKWLLPQMKPSNAVSSWRGPYGSRHDFEWSGQSIEVKVTTSSRGRIHFINGLEQLSPPEGGSLQLFSLRLKEEGGGANTLPGLITACRDALAENPDSLASFENSLASVGYSPAHDSDYEKMRFRIVDEALFDVRDPFPRITLDTFSEGVPSGVGVVRYEINLEGYDSLIITTSADDFRPNIP